jgi:hypothetical protein
MDNIIDDNDAYYRLKSAIKCTCSCTKHCGFSCMTDGCDCYECQCVTCNKTEDGEKQ